MGNALINGFLNKLSSAAEVSTSDSKGLRKIFPKETAGLISSFAKKENIDTKIFIDKNIPGAHYKPTTFLGKPVTGGGVHLRTEKTSPAVILHELGHASDLEKNEPLKSLGRILPSALAYARLPFAFYNPTLYRRMGVPTMAASIPTLYQEGKASYLATKHLIDEKGMSEGLRTGLKMYVPAFATYLITPATTALSLSRKPKTRALSFPITLAGLLASHILTKKLEAA